MTKSIDFPLLKDANRCQKVVGQNGWGKEFRGLSDNGSKNLQLKVIFPLNFQAGQKNGSAYAPVDLVSLVPLPILDLFQFNVKR